MGKQSGAEDNPKAMLEVEAALSVLRVAPAEFVAKLRMNTEATASTLTRAASPAGERFGLAVARGAEFKNNRARNASGRRAGEAVI